MICLFLFSIPPLFFSPVCLLFVALGLKAKVSPRPSVFLFVVLYLQLSFDPPLASIVLLYVAPARSLTTSPVPHSRSRPLSLCVCLRVMQSAVRLRGLFRPSAAAVRMWQMRYVLNPNPLRTLSVRHQS